MAKAVALGEKHMILGFKGVGFEVIPAQDAAELQAALGRLSRDSELSLVVITESLASESGEAIAEFRERSKAVLTVIPAHTGSKHVSFETMRKMVERSLGVDILGKD